MSRSAAAGHGSARSRLLPAFAVFLTFLPSRDVCAHSIGVSKGDYRVEGRTVVAELVFARTELLSAVTGVDVDADGAVAASEWNEAERAIAQQIAGALVVESRTGRCPGALDRTDETEEDGITIRATYVCPDVPDSILLTMGFLPRLSNGHRHLATARAPGRDQSSVLYGRTLDFRFDLPRQEGAGGGSSRPTALATFLSLVLLGIQHIVSVTAYDHLVFLLGLVLVGGTLRALFFVVTAFTIAHSITLGISALDVYSPSAGIVEPAIALSIAYVGVENWFVKDVSRRWMVTFPFGLIHGFGFAGALRGVSIPGSELPLALAAFNIGVELGQIAVLILLVPIVFWLRRKTWFLDRGVRATSAAIAVLGASWFTLRVL